MSDPFSSRRGTNSQYHDRPDNSKGPSSDRGNLNLDQYLDRLAEEIHQRVDHQRSIVKKILCTTNEESLRAPYCAIVDCPRLEDLRSLVRETIQVLEDTRRSFKCKQLEVMRKKLTDCLQDH